MDTDLELTASKPVRVSSRGFNRDAVLPYNLTVDHIREAMDAFTDFLGFIDKQLHAKKLPRLESLLMPANFSSIVGEFMNGKIPTVCRTLVKNKYHNGHPDLLPRGKYPGDAMQHCNDGIEIKASRYARGWQGHNAENCWLMVFVFESSRPNDLARGISPKPFRFLMVAGAKLEKTDWMFSGRSKNSRRTITASVRRSGYVKMLDNWIYKDTGALTIQRGE